MVCNAACGRVVRALAIACTLASPVLAADTGASEPKPALVPHELAVPAEPRHSVERDRQLGPGRYPPSYARAVLEVAGLLGLGVAQYWSNSNSNSRDWDFPRWSDRLSSSGIRFDNNTHVTNNVLHPLAGAAYYGFSRSNGLSVPAASLFTFAGSAIWEGTLEWREKVSINDMVATTAGGISGGEFFVQLASYLNSSPTETNLAQDVAKVTLGFPVWVHEELDSRPRDPRPARDNLGFSSEYTHRFGAA
ncbi:MAG TPA: DUF3943 domain-containing protein, partial [Polyangiaceae bacterium]|nr:DUF3943 domain-containing protein [Polyangiaceae bacterium]